MTVETVKKIAKEIEWEHDYTQGNDLILSGVFCSLYLLQFLLICVYCWEELMSSRSNRKIDLCPVSSEFCCPEVIFL